MRREKETLTKNKRRKNKGNGRIHCGRLDMEKFKKSHILPISAMLMTQNRLSLISVIHTEQKSSVYLTKIGTKYIQPMTKLCDRYIQFRNIYETHLFYHLKKESF